MNMKKVSEVQQILKSSETITRENLRDFIEEPLVEVVESLYDKNILTCMSSANKTNVNGTAWLSIFYDKLSEENKKIVQQKIKEGIAEMCYEHDSGKVIHLHMPITEQTTVDEVKNFFLSKISDFRMQDIPCNKYKSKSEILFAYLNKWHIISIPIHKFLKENPELESESNPTYTVNESSFDYETAVEDLGLVYCDEEDTFYESKEALRRHRNFLEYQKTELGKKEEELSSLEAEAKTISEAEALIHKQKEGRDVGE